VEGSTLKEVVSLSINVFKKKFGSFLDRPHIILPVNGISLDAAIYFQKWQIRSISKDTIPYI
jgi:hypothetical protein